MRMSSIAPPPGAYQIEELPGQPGKVLIRLYEHAELVSTSEHWVYDEYHIVADATDHLRFNVLDDYDALMKQAKIAEAERPPDQAAGAALLPRLDEIRYDARYMLLPEWVREQIERILDLS